MPENIRADYKVEQIPAHDFYIMGGKPYWTICRVHRRNLTFVELQSQTCHWCDPSKASEYLSDGKTKNPCYNHEVHRPYTKDEMTAMIESNRRYHKKTN